MKILFLHGFASCGLGNKSKQLIEHFGQDRILMPDLAYEPALAIQQCLQLIREQRVTHMIGASLGGYYAMVLNGHMPLPSVLINPAVQPWTTLDQHIGIQTRWCDGEQFEFTRTYGKQLQNMQRIPDTLREKYLVLLQEGDEVLDWRDAARLLSGFQLVIENGGDHRFSGFDRSLSVIEEFLTN